jgi:hypothetical protein
MLPDTNQSNPAFLIVEFGLAAFTMASAFAWPRLGSVFFSRVERLFARLASRKGMSVVVTGLSAILLRLALLPFYGVPLPFVPDDFSFLLAAETFAHGHLTNPTPAMWTHFESIHITMLPTYQSMYFPGQGLLLALGIVLFGHPWIGLLLVDGLMCGMLTWMLQAWLPPRWALLGGFIAVIRIGLFSFWINTYHTGALLAALGGALILGSLPRLTKTSRFRYGMLMGAGISILVLTRPYEGLLLCLPVSVVLGGWVWKGKNRPSALVLARRAAPPIVLILAAIAWLGFYDLKAFGKATTLPYTADRAQYAIAPYYFWQSPRAEPIYRHAVMKDFYETNEMGYFNKVHSWKKFLPATLEKALWAVLFYGGFTLLPPLLMVRRVFLDRRIRLLVICVCVLAAGLVIEIYFLTYYLAPFVGAFFAIGLQSMRHLRLWKPEGKPVGLAMVRLAVFSCVALAGMRLFAQPLGLAQSAWPSSNWNFTWIGPEHFGTERAGFEKALEQIPGGQLVIVRYGSEHNPLDEWVYNSPDIDHSKVIWAREMDSANNLELMRYYHDRKVWLVEPDAIPARLTPYPGSELQAGN